LVDLNPFSLRRRPLPPSVNKWMFFCPPCVTRSTHPLLVPFLTHSPEISDEKSPPLPPPRRRLPSPPRRDVLLPPCGSLRLRCFGFFFVGAPFLFRNLPALPSESFGFLFFFFPEHSSSTLPPFPSFTAASLSLLLGPLSFPKMSLANPLAHCHCEQVCWGFLFLRLLSTFPPFSTGLFFFFPPPNFLSQGFFFPVVSRRSFDLSSEEEVLATLSPPLSLSTGTPPFQCRQSFSEKNCPFL